MDKPNVLQMVKDLQAAGMDITDLQSIANSELSKAKETARQEYRDKVIKVLDDKLDKVITPIQAEIDKAVIDFEIKNGYPLNEPITLTKKGKITHLPNGQYEHGGIKFSVVNEQYVHNGQVKGAAAMARELGCFKGNANNNLTIAALLRK